MCGKTVATGNALREGTINFSIIFDHGQVPVTGVRMPQFSIRSISGNLPDFEFISLLKMRLAFFRNDLTIITKQNNLTLNPNTIIGITITLKRLLVKVMLECSKGIEKHLFFMILLATRNYMFRHPRGQATKSFYGKARKPAYREESALRRSDAPSIRVVH